MPATRIPGSAAGREIHLLFDGRRVPALEGEPVAASLLVAGRATLSRSFRFHRPRGLMCSTGQCGWCECEVDGVPSVRTCRVPARDGLVLRGEHAVPSVEHDLLGVLDVVSRLVPPTFYHHRFLRPRRLRKAYLDVIRWFGGRGRLPAVDAPFTGSRELRRDRADVLVVGAGRSGLAAASAARAAGARVIVLEADGAPFWTPPPASRATPNGVAGDATLDVRAGTAAIGWYDGVLGAVDATATWEIEAGAVVVATGSYELVPAVPGADRPGVLSAALVARLIERHGILPARRALMVGEGRDLDGVARLLTDAGATVLGPYATTSLVAVHGWRRVAGARVRVDGTSRVERADAVIFGDRTPSVELLMAAGAETAWDGGRLTPVLDAAGRTSAAGVFAVGGAAGLSGDEGQARRAAIAAAAHAAGERAAGGDNGTGRDRRPSASDRSGRARAAPAPAAVVCFCEDVRAREIAAEVAEGYADPELLKRRTGAVTGPCQGKYCLAAVAAAATGASGADPRHATDSRRAGDAGSAWLPPTARPPLRPVRLGDLAGAHRLAAPPDRQ